MLKDASATAVYGSRAANGVILVTTKNAKEDKVVINFNAFANLKTVLDKPDVLSAGEFAELANDYAKEFFANKPRAPYYTEEQIADFKQGREDTTTSIIFSTNLPLRKIMICLLRAKAARLLIWLLSATKIQTV